MKIKRKRNKGITLVALVVTVIILLILAGISIASLTGNGLFEKAKLAKEKQENAEIKEDKSLSDYENIIAQYVKGMRQDKNSSNIIKNLKLEILNTDNLIIARLNPETTDLNSIVGYVYILKCGDTVLSTKFSSGTTVNFYGEKSKQNTIIAIGIDKQGDTVKEMKNITLQGDNSLEISANNLTEASTIVTASGNHPGYDPYKAFDNSTETFWCLNVYGAQSGWIQYDFGKNAIVTKFKLIGQNNPAGNTQYLPSEFDLLGSNESDFLNYTKLGSYTIANATAKRGLEVEFEVENINSFRYYRIDVPKSQSYYMGIGTIIYSGLLID